MNVAQTVRVMLEDAWNRQDFTRFPLPPGGRFLLHIGGETREVGLPETEQLVARWHEGFPDFRFDVHSVIASGDAAAARVTLRGTHSGSWRGIDPTGRTVAVDHAFFFRFENGMLRDVWEVLDRSAFDVQLLDPEVD